jgi:hypothetical protein
MTLLSRNDKELTLDDCLRLAPMEQAISVPRDSMVAFESAVL